MEIWKYLCIKRMSKRRNNRRVMSGEGEWTYRCSLCQEFKTSDNFHSDNSKPPFNLAYNCKECRKSSCNRQPILLDWETEQGYLALESLGFDLKEDIHQQFIDRVEKKYGVVLL